MGAASKAAALVVYLCAGGACVALGWFAHAFWGVSAPVPRGMTSRATFVAVDEVASEKFNPPEEFVGHVEPVQEVDILPQIEGYIKEVKFAEGDEVKSGDLEGTVDGCHPHDWGMMSMGKAFSAGVAQALHLPAPRGN